MSSSIVIAPLSVAQRRAARALAVPTLHPAAVYVASLAPGSRRSTIGALRRAARFWGGTPAETAWCDLTFAHVVSLRSHLAETAAPATANRILSAVRGVLRFAVRLGLMLPSDAARVVDVPTVKGSRVQKGRSLSLVELSRMMGARQGREGARDRALLALLCMAGLRRAELVALNVEDFQDDTMRVLGKGNKERVVPLPIGCVAVLEQWLAVRREDAVGVSDVLERQGPLFYSRVGPLNTYRLSAQGLYVVLQRMAKDAGVSHFSPHDLRRTYIGDLLDAGVDLATVQSLVGHADPATTARYDRRGLRARRDAVAKLAVPG